MISGKKKKYTSVNGILPRATRHSMRLLLGTALAMPITIGMMPVTTSTASAAVSELIVTARKREESLQTVPLSIQAFSAEDIERSDITSLQDLQNFAPGVTLFENKDREYGQVFIRGMSNVPPVGDTSRELASIFIDGVYYTGGIPGVNIDDLERVEVVKGPQSALFGRSTFSGAINFVTKTPGNEFKGRLKAKLATDDEYEIAGSIEGPIVEDKLSARGYVRYRDFGGQYKAADGGDLGEQEDLVLSGTAYFTPNDNFDLKINTSYVEQEDGPPASTLLGRAPTHNCGPFGTGTHTFFCGDVEYNGSKDSVPTNTIYPSVHVGAVSRSDPGFSREFWFTSWEANLDIGEYTLSYLGGYTDEEDDILSDFDVAGEDAFWTLRTREMDSISHELRLSSPDEDRFSWLIGVYAFEQDLTSTGTFVTGADNPFFPAVFAPNITDRKLKNTAVFASASFDVTDQLTLTAEGRYQDDEVESQAAGGTSLSGSTKAFLPRVIVDFQASDDILLYALASKGNRPTTLNPTLADLTPANQALFTSTFGAEPVVDEETIWNYEIGMKSSWFDDQLIVNLAAFVADWEGFQGITFAALDLNGDLDVLDTDDPANRENHVVTIPGDDVEVIGVEGEIDWLITDSWSAGLNFAWNESKYKGSKLDSTIARFFGPGASSDGFELGNVPNWSATIDTTYTAPLANSDFNWFIRGEGAYVGSRWASVVNAAETGDSFDVNLRAGIQNERFEVTFFAENIFQDETVESLRIQGDSAADPITFFPRAYEAVLPKRRQIGVTATVNF